MRTLNRVLVIGSNGFSGASFIAHLLRQGIEVIGISRSPEAHQAFLPYRWDIPSAGFRFRQLDLNRNVDEIAALVRSERPDCVANFAAQSMVAESWVNPDHWFTTNVVATVRLHEALRRFDFLDSYVHVTTPEVYGSTTGTVGEDAPFNPSTPYAVSRAASDMSLRTYRTRYGFPVLFTRAANVFGEGQQLYRIIPRAILSIRGGRKLALHGGGHSERSFIHIDDVAEATSRIATGGTLGETYHISTNRIVTIRSLVAMICLRLGVEFDDHVDVVDERPGKDAAYTLDSTKLRTELGWRDRVTLDEGIDRTVAWIDRYLRDLMSMNWDYAHKP